MEYDDTGLKMAFRLNPDYVAVEGVQSEFDAPAISDADHGGKSK